MENQRSEAEALARCLELGLMNVTDAVAWADSQITASDVPNNVLCDISMASRANGSEVAWMLRQIPGDVDSAFVLRWLLKCCANGLQSDLNTARRVAAGLFRLASEGSLTLGELEQEAWWFDDALNLAIDGAGKETPEEVVAKMLQKIEAAIADEWSSPD